MVGDPHPLSRDAGRVTADDARFAEIASALADAVEAVVASWVERLVIDRVRAWSGHIGADVAAAAVTAGDAARREVMPRLRALLETDIDAQANNPMALLRDATRHADAVLGELGVPTSPRDQFARSSFPDDRYGLVPATWADIDPSLHDVGLTWGAAKAYTFKARRRDEGKT